MSTGEHKSPRSDGQASTKPAFQLPSIESMSPLATPALYYSIEQVAALVEHQPALVGSTEQGQLVVMSVMGYNQLVEHLATSAAGPSSKPPGIRASSDQVLAIHNDDDYWRAVEQMASIDRQIGLWEQAHRSNSGIASIVFEQACQVFEHVVPAIDWLGRPNVLLAGLKPSRLIATDAGARHVLAALGKIEHGIPV